MRKSQREGSPRIAGGAIGKAAIMSTFNVGRLPDESDIVNPESLEVFLYGLFFN